MGEADDREGGRRVRSGSGSLWILVTALALLLIILLLPEWAVRVSPETSCVVCHEMKEPVRRWRAAGVVKFHAACTDCHVEGGPAGRLQIHRMAWRFVREHLRRDPDEPIRLPPEPVLLDPARGPAYYSVVPNRRCSACKDAKSHAPMEQEMSHNRLIVFASSQPCKDCHSHEMRHGQPFYEKILPDPR
jgi:trimethylamine-N-oxide reductase (cytochrome c) cytochrome c-type subunit TorY